MDSWTPQEVYLKRFESRPFADLELEFPSGLIFRTRAMHVDGKFLIAVAHYHQSNPELSFTPIRIADYPVQAEGLLKEVLLREFDRENSARTHPYKLVDMTSQRRSEVH